MSIQLLNNTELEQDDPRLTPLQQRLLSRCRRNPKSLSVMLRQCRISAATFAEWRTDPHFDRAFKRATATMTRDTLTDLRYTFAMCGRIISSQMAQIQSKKKNPEDFNPAMSRLCFDVLKVGMNAFAPKPTKRRSFPRIDPALLAQLLKAQQPPQSQPTPPESPRTPSL